MPGKRKTKRAVAQHRTPTTSTARNGALLYQTAIMDLRERKAVEAKLRASEQRYRTLFDLVPVAVYACDVNGVIQDFNRRAVELWGREPNGDGTKEKFCGSHKIYHPDGRFIPHEECPMARVLRGEKLEAKDLEILVERMDGERRNVVVAPRTLTNGDGDIIGAINCFYDITARKLTEEKIRESEERLRATINQSNAGIASCDLHGRFSFANQKFCKMLGYAESEVIGKTIFAITHPDDVDVTRRCFQQMVREKQPVKMEKRYICKDGSLIWVDVCDTPVLDATGKPASAMAVAIDITERKKAEVALQKSKVVLEQRVRERTRELRAANLELEKEIKRRRGLEGQILEISDREQQRLGQELHDGLCQHLTAVAFMARSIALRLKNHRVIEVNDLEKIAQLVNGAAHDARDLSHALHRLDIDSAKLTDALQDLVDREIWQTPCRLEIKEPLHITDDEIALHLYRIAREAVINANKHAQATQIVIGLKQSSKEIVLSITDDGVGVPNESNKAKGLGFHIMKYRALSAGGRLEVKSPRKGGTRVVCYLPAPR